MKRVYRTLLLFVAPCLALSACAAGSSLHLPGDLTRPAGLAARPAGAPRAVIADFSFPASPDGALGRDFDRARPIVWKGEPGKAMADLVAAALEERGIAVIRRGAGAPGADAVPVTISGTVRRFEVNARRSGVLSVDCEAAVSVVVRSEGTGLPAPAEQTVSSSASLSDLFVTPDGLREVLLSTANAVAEETARRLIEGSVLIPSPVGKQGGTETPR